MANKKRNFCCHFFFCYQERFNFSPFPNLVLLSLWNSLFFLAACQDSWVKVFYPVTVFCFVYLGRWKKKTHLWLEMVHIEVCIMKKSPSAAKSNDRQKPLYLVIKVFIVINKVIFFSFHKKKFINILSCTY